MKIIHIIPTLGSGGAERMLSKLVENDRLNNHRIVTLLDSDLHYDVEKKFNIEVIRIAAKNNTINKILIIFRLILILKNRKFDVVQTWSKANYYAPLIKLVNPSLKVATNFRNGYSGKQSKLKNYIIGLYFKIVDSHIFVSKSALDERSKVGLNFRSPVIINNGFELPNVEPMQTVKDEIVFGHIGRYHPVKNQLNIIKAFLELKTDSKVKLLLAGKGLNPECLEIEEDDLSNITFLGELTEVSDFYEEIDVLILASKSEGFPNVIGEAMSYGKYIITTDAGESFDIIGDGGMRLSNGDSSTIKKALEVVIENSELLVENSNENIETIRKKYSIDKIVMDYQNFYKKLGDKK